jgi:hypothetical protein
VKLSVGTLGVLVMAVRARFPWHGVSLEVVTIVDGDYGVGFPIVMLLPCCFERVHLSLKMG